MNKERLLFIVGSRSAIKAQIEEVVLGLVHNLSFCEIATENTVSFLFPPCSAKVLSSSEGGDAGITENSDWPVSRVRGSISVEF